MQSILRARDIFVTNVADINLRGYIGKTPLHSAVQCDAPKAARFLLANNAARTLTNHYNSRPEDLINGGIPA